MCILIVDGNRPLENNWTGIHAGIDKMNGTASNLDSILEGLPLCVKTFETRQEGRMDIDDGVRPLGHKFTA